MILSATQTTRLKPCTVNGWRLTYDEAKLSNQPYYYHFSFWCLVILWEMMSKLQPPCGARRGTSSGKLQNVV